MEVTDPESSREMGAFLDCNLTWTTYLQKLSDRTTRIFYTRIFC